MFFFVILIVDCFPDGRGLFELGIFFGVLLVSWVLVVGVIAVGLVDNCIHNSIRVQFNSLLVDLRILKFLILNIHTNDLQLPLIILQSLLRAHCLTILPNIEQFALALFILLILLVILISLFQIVPLVLVIYNIFYIATFLIERILVLVGERGNAKCLVLVYGAFAAGSVWSDVVVFCYFWMIGFWIFIFWEWLQYFIIDLFTFLSIKNTLLQRSRRLQILLLRKLLSLLNLLNNLIKRVNRSPLFLTYLTKVIIRQKIVLILIQVVKNIQYLLRWISDLHLIYHISEVLKWNHPSRSHIEMSKSHSYFLEPFKDLIC